MGGLKSGRLKSTQKLCSLLACSFAGSLETSVSPFDCAVERLSHIPSGENPHMPPKFQPEKQGLLACCSLTCLKLLRLH